MYSRVRNFCMETKFTFNSPNYSQKMNKLVCKPFIVVVEGNIGCGKTTFLNYFSKNNNILTKVEPVDKWKDLAGYDLLSLVYKDFSKWSFTFQSYVQLTMMKEHNERTDKPIKVIERSLFSARYVFVENLVQQNLISGAEFAVLDEWFKWLCPKIENSIDLIVYLRCDPEVAYKRIKNRLRTGEDLLTIDHVRTIHECYEDWLCRNTKFTCPAPVLFLNANKDLSCIQQEYGIFQDYVKSLSSFEL